MSKDSLTEKQAAILDMMVKHWQREGITPTVREIAAHFKINSPNGVICHLVALEKKGYVVNVGGRGSHCWRPKYRTVGVCCPECCCEIEVVEEL